MTTKLYSSEEINTVFNSNLNKNLFFNKVAIDSREVSNRGIFFAIKGNNDDGHRYVKEVLKNKNNLAIVSKGPKNERSIRSQDTLESLKDFGEQCVFPTLLNELFNKFFNEVFPQLPVMAIIFASLLCLA